MRLDLDLRGVNPDTLSRLAGIIEEPATPEERGHPVAIVIAAGIRAAMQSGEPVSVSLPLTEVSPAALREIGNWAQELRDHCANNDPAIAAMFCNVMIAVRDEEELRKISVSRRRREELFGDDVDDSTEDAEWTTL